jgi:hypothetical protein
MASYRSREKSYGKILKLLLDNWEQLADGLKENYKIGEKEYNQKFLLTQYFKKSVSDPDNDELICVDVKYQYSKLGRETNSGRQFARNALSLQSFSREIRHTITKGLYNDIDMKNAHFNILLQYCKKHNYPYKYLERSVVNNEQYIKDIQDAHKIDRKEAKQLKLSVLYGSDDEINVPWFKKFKAEINEIHEFILKDVENSEKIDLIKKYKKSYVPWLEHGKVYNLKGKVCSFIMCEIENNILMSCLDFLKSLGISTKNIILEFDGFEILKDIFNPTEEILEKLSEFTKKATGYKMTFVNKPRDEDLIDISNMKPKKENIIINVEDDAEASRKLIEIMNGRIISCKGEIYVKTSNTKVWTNNEKEVEREIINASVDIEIRMTTEKSSRTYSRNVSGIKNMLMLVKALCPTDENFSETLRLKSAGKLFFSDCVYDFKLQKTRPETNDDMTPIRINRPYPTNIDKEVSLKVIRILNSIFDKDYKKETLSPTSLNMLEHYARALALHLEDKDFIIGIGLRDCGKGILTKICLNAFYPYVSEVNSNNFINNSRVGATDEAKNRMWLLNHRWSRIVFGNEIDIEDKDGKKDRAVLNGILIKSLSSGGDKQRARGLYKDEVEFVFGGRIFLFLNDMPDVRPADTCQTMTLFEFPNKFLKEDEYDALKAKGELDVYMKRGINNLKEQVLDEKFRDAFIDLVLKSYKNKPVVNTPEIQKSCKEYRIEAGDDILFIKEHFDFSDKKAEMASSEVLEEVKKRFPSISAQKIKSFLTKNMNLEYSNHLKDVGRGFIGIRLKEPKEKETDI